MPTLSAFSTPALVQDLATQPLLQIQLNELWNNRVEAFVQQAIFGDPWNTSYASNQTAFYDPTQTDMPSTALTALVAWVPFPNRLIQYCGQPQSGPVNPYKLSQQQLYSLADYAYYIDNNGNQQTFPEIPSVLCPQADWTSTLKPYGPYGPRGWLDEYCEWSVTRNAQGKITRIDFVCENPEYWYSLWRISPSTAADVYTQTLNFGLPTSSPNAVTVHESDLYLYDQNNNPVIDPSTGAPAYDPLNKWNSGTISVRGAGVAATGGAMHLTSTPNTLQTELGLAGAATVQRTIGNYDQQKLICCAQYGQEYRNSDPFIGQSVNQVVSGPPQQYASLADPLGLYIQAPDFSSYILPPDPNLPQGATAADCWQVVRGLDTILDPVTQTDYPGNFILHVAFQLPAAWIEAGVSFTVSDIMIRLSGVTSPIQYAGQIAQTMKIGLFARPIPAAASVPALPCVGTPAVVTPQPVQMMYLTVWDAYYAQSVSTPVGVTMSLASNTVIVPMVVSPGQTFMAALTSVGAVQAGSLLPTVTDDSGDITFTTTSLSSVTYAAPGNSYPSQYSLLMVTGVVSSTAQPGLRGVSIANPGAQAGPPAPALINVS
jgi:hypothetical protein